MPRIEFPAWQDGASCFIENKENKAVCLAYLTLWNEIYISCASGSEAYILK